MTNNENFVKPEDMKNQFRLMDDDFMRLVFGDDKEVVQYVLRIIMENSTLEVVKVESQKEIKNPNGRSIRIDVFAKDATGKYYDIEIQRADKGAGEGRARFNSSLLDSKMLGSGDDTAELCDSYVIFFTENDFFGENLPLYHIERCIKETNKPFADGSHIIYVNGSYRNKNSEIGQLISDFLCSDYQDMTPSVLSEKVKYFKTTEGGEQNMCKMIEDYGKELRAEGKAEGIAEGRAEATEETIALLIKNGLLPEDFTAEDVKTLAEKDKNDN